MRASRVLTTTDLPHGAFPRLGLPLPIPYPVMESIAADRLPEGDGWQFEPKWDGFRCLVFRHRDDVVFQSKGGQPLARYFPEVVAAVRRIPAGAFVLDGELVVSVDGCLSFDHLLQRVHPAESRIRRLAAETPATFMAFDLLCQDGRLPRAIVDEPLREPPPSGAIRGDLPRRSGYSTQPGNRRPRQGRTLDVRTRGDGIGRRHGQAVRRALPEWSP